MNRYHLSPAGMALLWALRCGYVRCSVRIRPIGRYYRGGRHPGAHRGEGGGTGPGQRAGETRSGGVLKQALDNGPVMG